MIPLTLTALFIANPLVLHGARVEVGDGTTLHDATVVIQDGRISYVGPKRADAGGDGGAEVIQASGKVLTAGLIEAMSHLGLVEMDLEDTTTDFAPHDDAILPAFSAADGFNPSSVLIPVARAEGVTRAVTSPAGGILWGTGYLAALTGRLDSRPDRRTPVAMFGGLGTSAAKASGGTRGSAWMRLRQLLADARLFLDNRTAAWRGQTHRFVPSPLQLAAMEPVLRRALPLVLSVHRASDILAALDLARDENLRIVIAGGAESWRVRDQLAAARVPVILTPSDQAPTSFEALAARDDVSTLLAAAGVPVIISTGNSNHNARRLRQEAGIATAHGLDWQKALTAITLAPAAAFGRGDELGSVAVGKQADLVLWSGDPFELQTVVERVWIGGAEQSLRTRQKQLAARYAGRKR
ncbi:MAG: amidohydrolase family protein [Deltaproteobacteria bacterium]|nr:amidohydrolase family protein [Deltaproteobacteria bacterium]